MMGADRAQAFITPDSVDFVRYKPKGQKLIYLDPRYTETAAKADKWFPVKPGTDMAFILGIIHEIIDKEMYDREFIETYTHGFSELAAFVKEKGYTPEWAEEKCEIPASEIRWCARQFAANAPRSVVYPGRRSSFYWKEVYFRRACAILAALCGCWDTKGAVAPKASISLNSHSPLFPFFMQAKNRIDEEAVETVKNLVPSAIKCPMVGTGLPEDSCAFLSERDGSWVTFREAILNDDPYPVRGLFVFKQNPVQAVPNVKKTLKMMEKMEFICVVEQQMSDTAWYADLVLPHSTYLESWDPCHVLSGIWPSVVFRQPVIKPMFDTRTMFEISRGVIEEMLKIPSLWDDTDEQAVKDFKKDVVDGILKHSVRDIIKFQLSKHPGAHEKIMQDGVFFLSDKPQYGSTRKPGYRFSTKSGKIELLNERYKQRGLFELPEYCEPKTEPDKDTYRFLVGRRAWNTHAGTQNIPYLWEIQKENSIWINTREAEKLGVRTGDYVHVTSSVGEQKVRVLATEAIRPDCVYFVNGWNRRSPRMSLVYKRGASEAEILEDTLESISGSAAMHETLVRIRRA
jgi:thiosulfate reductase/polysulfide reductase chain A